MSSLFQIHIPVLTLVCRIIVHINMKCWHWIKSFFLFCFLVKQCQKLSFNSCQCWIKTQVIFFFRLLVNLYKTQLFGATWQLIDTIRSKVPNQPDPYSLIRLSGTNKCIIKWNQNLNIGLATLDKVYEFTLSFGCISAVCAGFGISIVLITSVAKNQSDCCEWTAVQCQRIAVHSHLSCPRAMIWPSI